MNSLFNHDATTRKTQEQMFHSAKYTAGGAVCQVTCQCYVQIIVQEGFLFLRCHP